MTVRSGISSADAILGGSQRWRCFSIFSMTCATSEGWSVQWEKAHRGRSQNPVA
jgi:hypothetical protein